MTAHSEKLTTVSLSAKSYIYLAERTKFSYSRNLPYDEWSLLICEEGLIEYEVGSQSGQATAGDIVLCPPGQVLQRKALTTISFHFAVFELTAFRHNDEFHFPYVGKLTFKNKEYFSFMMNQLKRSKESISMDYTEHLLTSIVYQVIWEQQADQTMNRNRDPLIVKALEYIHVHIFDRISTQAVADYVGLYQSQFTRKFQKQVGMPPSRYIISLRIQKVQRLLIETEEPLEWIAGQCGYQNEFYLSRVFSKEVGLSPSRFRHMHRV